MRYDNWDDFMAAQRRSGLLQRISDFVTAERRRHSDQAEAARNMLGPEPDVYPPSGDVMRFTTTPLRDVKVVILGQDPYHGPGQAHGLAFSVPNDVDRPPSLRNIHRELADDLGLARSVRSLPNDLTPWTRQGVLLLNTALTVRQADPGSHLDIWQPFTDEVVRCVVDSADVNVHFTLWGKFAKATFERAVGRLRNSVREDILVTGDPPYRKITATYSSHPSPLSADRGFFGSRPFSSANLALKLNNPGSACQVDWRLP